LHTSALPRLPTSCCCYSITQESYPAIAGDYSTWVPPYSYASMDQLEENVGYKVNGTCLRNATLQQLLLCPAGQESLPADELADHCQVLNVTCPAVSTTPPEKAKKKRKGYACRRQFDEKSTIIPGCPGTTFNAVDAFGCCVCLRLCCIPVKCLLMSSDASLRITVCQSY